MQNSTQEQYIIPAIIPGGIESLTDDVRAVRGALERVQVDVMDGTYTSATSWPYNSVDRDVLATMRRQDDGLPFWQDVSYEVDLMVEQPEKHIDEWILAGAQCLIVHVETADDIQTLCERIHAARVEFAIALKPSTDLSLLAPCIERAVFVQCMGNDHVGEHGLPLHVSVLDKIRAIRTRWPGTVVGVDIGVNERTIVDLVRAGARRFAVGSALYALGEPALAAARLEQIVLTTLANE